MADPIPFPSRATPRPVGASAEAVAAAEASRAVLAETQERIESFLDACHMDLENMVRDPEVRRRLILTRALNDFMDLACVGDAMSLCTHIMRRRLQAVFETPPGDAA